MIEEPLLRGGEIQGDSLAGFRKDHVSLLFVRFDAARIADVKGWLRALEPRLARLNAVAAFNARFRRVKREMPFDPDVLFRRDRLERKLAATWVNIAFTAQGLTKLVGADAVAQLETAFGLGAHVRAVDIGDPDDGSPGSPRCWIIGGPGNVPDAMINVAADLDSDRIAEVTRIRDEIAALGGAIAVMHEDVGNAKIAPHRGHEHFGFKDGISQPGVRGKLDSAGEPLLTPRLIDAADPIGQTYASPGVPLIQPGEFVLGYPRQAPNNPGDTQNEADTRVVPDWARDGSYIVYKRLQQDVPAFERFLDHGVTELAGQGITVDRDRFGAMCVGRWKDGTPVARSPLYPDPDIARDRHAPQSFFFWKDTAPVQWADGGPVDGLPPALMDGDGQRCPLPGHIRKINPRDEATDVGHGVRTLRRRIIRRGVTYGPSYRSDPAAERGLLFLCYQASIADQFEFLWRVWANKVNTPRAAAGFDPVIGQNGNAAPESRTVNFVQGDVQGTVTMPERFVISTGGAYLFAPSISAIRDFLGA